MMRKRASRSTMLGMARTRLCMSRPSGRTLSMRSQYAFGKMWVKASIFMRPILRLPPRRPPSIAAVELVGPAGSLPALKAAIDNGADWVYAGLRDDTNARNFAGLNFDAGALASGL